MPMWRPHAFVAMPFGAKPGPDGRTAVQFDRVLQDLLQPALHRAGCEVFRADEEMRAGDIRADMFQELLIADLVVADLTIANPNVWYELGVRHALRARGVVLVYGTLPGVESPKAFDLYTDRKLRYHLNSEGLPDAAGLAESIAALAQMARDTLASPTRRKVSPVYQLLPQLQQPRWTALLLKDANEFSETYLAWADRMEVARQMQRPGDVLTLAEETPTRALALEARRMAGDTLLQMQQPALALEQYDQALTIDAQDLPSRQKRVVCLGRLGHFAEARSAANALLREWPGDAETLALAGRVEKDDWTSRWRPAQSGVDVLSAPQATPSLAPGAGDAVQPPTDLLRAAAAAEDALLADAIAPYRRGFEADPGHGYSGINALTLSTLRAHLGGPAGDDLAALQGGLRWAAMSRLARTPNTYWARATLAELNLLCGDASAMRDWQAAVAAADGDWFALDSSHQTLAMLRDLGFRPAQTGQVLACLEREMARLAPPFQPRQVLLFSGHLMDAPDRQPPRFPAAMEPAAALAIGRALDELQAGPLDLALSQAAAGGDMLFLEACAQRGVRSQVLLPLEESEFIARSVLRSVNGTDWRRRWFARKPGLASAPRSMAQALGPLPRGANVFERCNRWLLNTALACGPDRLRFICLWDGGGADGPGGTRHMMDEATRRTGRVHWIDTRTL